MWLKSLMKSFREFCADAHVPEGYRTEAVRLELLYNLEMMESDERLARGVTSLYEEPFSFELEEGAILKGTVDRIEVDAEGNATVIDYKYRSKLGTDKTKKGHEEQTAVQGGLYLLAAEQMGFKPADMVYCGIKRDVHFAGWMTSSRYPEIKQAVDARAAAERDAAGTRGHAGCDRGHSRWQYRAEARR